MKHFALLICLAALISSGCSISDKRNAVPAVSSQGQTLTLQTSEGQIWIGPAGQGFPHAATLTAEVRDALGQFVDGIEVVFEVEPSWRDSASVTPIQAVTHNGIARAVLTAETIGLFHVTARTDGLVEKTRILVQHREGPGSGSGGPNLYY